MEVWGQGAERLQRTGERVAEATVCSFITLARLRSRQCSLMELSLCTRGA